MLAFLRKRAQSIVIQAIVVVIALVFIFWGVGTNMMNRQQSAITVNGENISFQQYQQAYDQAYNRLAQQFGGTMPKGLAESFNLKQQVINQLIRETLLRQGGHEMGLQVSSREVQQHVQSQVQFQNNGSFDMQRYQSLLAANRLSPTKYEESLRHELIGNKTIKAIAGFASTVSEGELNDLYALQNETLTVQYAAVSPLSYVDTVTVDEDALKKWYETAGDRYKTAKQVKLTYLPFLFADEAAKVSVSDEEIANYYEQHLAQYRVPEQRHARHILFKTGADSSKELRDKQRALAETVLEKARAGEDFAALAKQYSEDGSAEQGGDLGYFSRGQMVKPFEDAVFAMTDQEISGIVTTDFGFHIIKLEGIRPAKTSPLDEVKAEIADQLKLERSKGLTFQVAQTTYEGIIEAGSLSAYLDQHQDTTAVKTDFFSRAAAPKQLSTDAKFLDVAFSLNKGELSSLAETEKGYAIISVDDIREPQVPPLSDVRETAEKDYKKEQADAKARQIAQEMIDKLGAGEAVFAAVAKEAGVAVSESGPLKKSGPVNASEPFPRELVSDAFRMTRSAPVNKEPASANGNYYVISFVDRKPPTNAIPDDQKAQYRSVLLQFKQEQLVDAWLENRQRDAKITIHQSLNKSDS